MPQNSTPTFPFKNLCGKTTTFLANIMRLITLHRANIRYASSKWKLNAASSSSSSCGLSCGGRCCSYELAPCLPILSSVIGSCQTNVQGARSDSMVRNQVCRGRPERRCQSLGRGVTLARRARLWSMEASARAMWPKNFRRAV